MTRRPIWLWSENPGQPGEQAAARPFGSDDALFDRAIDLDPKYALAWFDRGGAYKDLGQWDKALADWRTTLEIASSALPA